MINTLRKLTEKAFDLEALAEAVAEEISGRIDYAALAESLCDAYEDTILQEAYDLAEELLPLSE